MLATCRAREVTYHRQLTGGPTIVHASDAADAKRGVSKRSEASIPATLNLFLWSRAPVDHGSSTASATLLDGDQQRCGDVSDIFKVWCLALIRGE